MENLPTTLLDHFQPAAQALGDRLYRLIDKSMLQQIAEADYGHDAAQYLEQLQKIKQERQLPNNIHHYPMEVLALTRWLLPDAPDVKPRQSGHRGHLLRAFSCSVLLEAGVHPVLSAYGSGSLNESLVGLVDSVLHLGGLEAATLSTLSWQVQQLSDSYQEERAFYAYAILLLSMLRADGHMSTVVLSQLVSWVEDEVALLQMQIENFSIPYPNEPYLFALTFHNQRHDLWKELSQKMVNKARLLPNEAVRQMVIDIGNRMLGK